MRKKRYSRRKQRRAAKRWGVLRSFNLVSPINSFVVVLGLFVSSIFELFGFALIVPLLATLSSSSDALGGKKALITGVLDSFFGLFGLEVNVVSLVAFVAIGLTIKSVINILVMLYVSHIMSDITGRVRIDIIRNLLSVRWNFFTRQPIVRFIHGVGGDTAAIGESFYSAASLVASVIQVLAYIALSFLISWQLSLLSIGVGGFMVLTYGYLVNLKRGAGDAKRYETRRMIGAFSDAIQGIKPIKAMNRHARLQVLLEADNKIVGEAIRNKVISVEFASEFQEPIVGVAILIGLYFATTHWGIGFHEQFVVALILIKMIATIGQFQNTYGKLEGLKSPYMSSLRLLKETNDVREDMSGIINPTLRDRIVFDNVHFDYPNKKVLAGASFEIPAGHITALAGPSGAGKTTIADIVLRLYKPTDGRVLVDNANLNDIDLVKWRSMIGYVPQDVLLFHDTIFHNVTLGHDECDEHTVREALRSAGALDFVEELEGGIHYIVGERGMLLSGGQRQRIAIARALLLNPSFIIMDEATTALDPQTEQAICHHMVEVCRERRLTILAISHQPAWRQIADQVLEIVNGRVIVASRQPALSVIAGENEN